MEIKKELDVFSGVKIESSENFLEYLDYNHELFENIEIEDEFKTESSRIEKINDVQTKPSKNELVYCSSCNKVWNYSPQVEKSCLTCSTVLLFKCGICMRLYSTLRTLKHHSISKCNKELKFSQEDADSNTLVCCTNCYKIWKNLSPAEKSCLTCGSALTYKCEICTKQYSDLLSFNQHKLLYCPKEPAFSCKQCLFKGDSDSDLARHYEAKHFIVDSISNKCMNCKKNFSNSYGLRRHLKTCYLSEEVKPTEMRYSCRGCDYKTDHKSHFRRHVQAKHFERNNCTKCNKNFPSPPDLRKHLKLCGLSNEQKSSRYSCIGCDYKTEHKSRIVRHLRASLQDTNSMRCTKCDKKFLCFFPLRSHSKICGLSVEEKRSLMRFSCIDCSYKTSQKSHIVRHIQAKHAPKKWPEHLVTDNNMIDDNVLVCCTICNKLWKNLSRDEKSCISCGSAFTYKCGTCMRGYSKIQPLMKHQNLYCTREPKFSCEKCLFKSHSKKDLSRHIESDHSVRDSNANTCLKCKKTFLHLKLHLRICGLSEKAKRSMMRYSCNGCDYKTNIKSRLMKHVQASFQDTISNKCTKCDQKFLCLFALRSHSVICGLSEKEKRSLKRFSCADCDYKSNYKSHFRRHLQARHAKDLPQWPVIVADHSTTNVADENIDVGHELKTESFRVENFGDDQTEPSCYSNDLFENIEIGHELCEFKPESSGIGKIDQSEPSLFENIEFEHEFSTGSSMIEKISKKEPFENIDIGHEFKTESFGTKKICDDKIKVSHEKLAYCSKCNKNWNYETEKSCGICGSDIRYQCKKCKKIYDSILSLSQHLQGGCKEFKFRCAHCDYKSQYESDVVQHIKAKHVDQNSVSYKCSKCEKNFSCKESLQNHSETCGNPKYKNYSLARLSCDHCNYKSCSKKILTRHIRSKHLRRVRRIFKCRNCHRKLSSFSCLTRHSKVCDRIKHKKRRLSYYSCDYCHYKTYLKKNIARHIHAKHLPKDPEVTECSLCRKKLSNSFSLKRHFKVCGQTKDKISALMHYSSDYCQFKTKSKENLGEHIDAIHLPNDLSSNACSECGKNFTRKVSYERHLKTCGQSTINLSHSNENFADQTGEKAKKNSSRRENSYLCKRCAKSFSTKSGLSVHLKYCGQSEERKLALRRFPCSYCNYKTDFKAFLDRHIKTEHSENSPEVFNNDEFGFKFETESPMIKKILERPLINKDFKIAYCPKCQITRNYHRNLRKSCHRCNTAFRYKCAKCTKDYSKIKLLLIHIKQYCQREIILNCDHCDYTTSRKHHFFRHVQTKHMPRDPELNKCNKCGKNFAEKRNLSRHLKVCNHIEGSSHGTMSCDHCDYKTHLKFKLSKHIQTHLSTDLYSRKCGICKKIFSQKRRYRKHLKICGLTDYFESLFMRYSCDYCGFKTNTKSYLDTHIRAKHLPLYQGLYACKKCGKIYLNKSNFLHHSKFCENSNNTSMYYSCDGCTYKTRFKSNLRRHIRIPQKNLFEKACFNCQKIYNSRGCYKTHVKTCTQLKNDGILYDHSYCKSSVLSLLESNQAKHLDHSNIIPQPDPESNFSEDMTANLPEPDYELSISEDFKSNSPEPDHELSISEDFKSNLPEPDHVLNISEDFKANLPELHHELDLSEVIISNSHESEPDHESNLSEHVQANDVIKPLYVFLNRSAESQKSIKLTALSLQKLKLMKLKICGQTNYIECPFKRFNCSYKSDCKSNIWKHMRATHLQLELQTQIS